MQNETGSRVRNISESPSEHAAVADHMAADAARTDPFEEYIGEKLKRVHDGKVRFQALFDKAKTDEVRISYSLAKRSASEQEQIWTVLQSFYQTLQHVGTTQDEEHSAVAYLRKNLAALNTKESSSQVEQDSAVAGLNRRVSGLAKRENASQAEQDVKVAGLKRRVSGLAKKEKVRQQAEDYLLEWGGPDPTISPR
jgi:septation ring formation regulator EzrA